MTQPCGSHAHAQAARQNIASRSHPRENGDPEARQWLFTSLPFSRGGLGWGQVGEAAKARVRKLFGVTLYPVVIPVKTGIQATITDNAAQVPDLMGICSG